MITTFHFASDVKTRQVIRIYRAKTYEVSLKVVDHSATIDEEHHMGIPLGFNQGRSSVDYSPHKANREYIHKIFEEVLPDVDEAFRQYRWNLAFMDEDPAYSKACDQAVESKVRRLADEFKIPVVKKYGDSQKPIGVTMADPLRDVALDDIPIVLPLKFKSNAQIVTNAKDFFGDRFTCEIVLQSDGKRLLMVEDFDRPDRWAKFSINHLGWREVEVINWKKEEKVDPKKRIHSKIKTMRRAQAKPSPVDLENGNRMSADRLFLLTEVSPAEAGQGQLENGRQWIYVGKGSPWQRKEVESLDQYKDRLNGRIQQNRTAAIKTLSTLADKILICERHHWLDSHADALIKAAAWAKTKLEEREQEPTKEDAPSAEIVPPSPPRITEHGINCPCLRCTGQAQFVSYDYDQATHTLS